MQRQLTKAQINGLAQPGGQINRQQGRPLPGVHRCDHQEGQADGGQHLRQFTKAIDPAIDDTLQRHGDHNGASNAKQSRPKERQAHIADQPMGQHSARQGKAPVCQIDHSHEPHGHRQADRDHKEDHAVGHAIDKNVENKVHGYFVRPK